MSTNIEEEDRYIPDRLPETEELNIEGVAHADILDPNFKLTPEITEALLKALDEASIEKLKRVQIEDMQENIDEVKEYHDKTYDPKVYKELESKINILFKKGMRSGDITTILTERYGNKKFLNLTKEEVFDLLVILIENAVIKRRKNTELDPIDLQRACQTEKDTVKDVLLNKTVYKKVLPKKRKSA